MAFLTQRYFFCKSPCNVCTACAAHSEPIDAEETIRVACSTMAVRNKPQAAQRYTRRRGGIKMAVRLLAKRAGGKKTAGG
jgi:hypothetical protein